MFLPKVSFSLTVCPTLSASHIFTSILISYSVKEGKFGQMGLHIKSWGRRNGFMLIYPWRMSWSQGKCLTLQSTRQNCQSYPCSLLAFWASVSLGIKKTANTNFLQSSCCQLPIRHELILGLVPIACMWQTVLVR
jgi:hypothetical protein